MCGWNAEEDEVLSSPRTAGPENLEPYDRAWPPLPFDLSQPSLFYLTPFLFFPFSAPFTHSNFQFHPQIELLSWHLFGLMSQHVISSSFLVTQGKGIVVWSSEAISTSYSSFSTSNDSASWRATATAVKTKPHARLKSWTCQQGHVSVASPLLREALGNKSRWHCKNSRSFLKL